ncbi:MULTISPECIES: hypothetical protein [unclassified Mesorhizobium]|uniref:hypothetical protein n=1 Tax=unclassified Mesorhizobium TaxID=325217 RepID=UPI000FE47076|nr:MULTISPECIES: hypothetical protein [unclassified Mesorhizobium]RWE27248.1 MAG: hypothetical protein EOS41_03350 [Mesorhizobium sp.]TGT54384.1 hypothetical protein EN813_043170 [Mesorhizobium sp. M00.F.Ca.ET.170.01.1.1]
MNHTSTNNGLRIHTIIFCWPNKVDNVTRIYQQARLRSAKATVIDSSLDPIPEGVTNDDWLKIDSSHYYGMAFKRALECFDGDILLQIQGDVLADDFGKLVDLCYKRFYNDSSLGIWSPEIDNTAFPTRNVEIMNTRDPHLKVVAMTDCIVWALTVSVVRFLRTLEYSDNNLGWGIDWAACAYSFANKLSVMRDASVSVIHPPGSGYGHEEARRQQAMFLSQLGRAEAIQYALLSRRVFGR